MRLKKLYLLPLGILACGCATTAYQPATSPRQFQPTPPTNQQGSFVSQLSPTHSCTREQVDAGEKFPLKLDARSLDELNRLAFTESSAAPVKAFSKRFYTSGDYPVLSLTVTQTYDNRPSASAFRDGSVMQARWTVDTNATALVMPSERSRDLYKELTASSRCSGGARTNSWESRFGEALESIFHDSSEYSFSRAANELLYQLELMRSEVETLHEELLFSK